MYEEKIRRLTHFLGLSTEIVEIDRRGRCRGSDPSIARRESHQIGALSPHSRRRGPWSPMIGCSRSSLPQLNVIPENAMGQDRSDEARRGRHRLHRRGRSAMPSPPTAVASTHWTRGLNVTFLVTRVSNY